MITRNKSGSVYTFFSLKAVKSELLSYFQRTALISYLEDIWNPFIPPKGIFLCLVKTFINISSASQTTNFAAWSLQVTTFCTFVETFTSPLCCVKIAYLGWWRCVMLCSKKTRKALSYLPMIRISSLVTNLCLLSLSRHKSFSLFLWENKRYPRNSFPYNFFSTLKGSDKA